MTASYPSTIKSWTARTDNSDDVLAADVNTAYLEITAIETALGLTPEGTAADLVTRLNRSQDGKGNLNYATSTVLTIASGSVTPTQNYHLVDTESSASTDSIDTIAATNVTDGFQLDLRMNNDARVVTLKHNTGNIKCPGSVDMSMISTGYIISLVYDSNLSYWIVKGFANAALLNSANTWTGYNKFTGGWAPPLTSISTTTTLTPAQSGTIKCNAASGAFTVNLPTAVGYLGMEFTFIKTDSSANAVTIDGYGTETLNEALTKALTSQWAHFTVQSDGANYIVTV
jgi:hypothetical protein